MANPWATECPEGTLLSILASQGCQSDVIVDDVADNPSLKIISALNEISALSSQIHAGELEVLQRNLHRDNKELVGVDNLAQIATLAEEVAQTVTLVLDNRDTLLERIRTPHDPGRLVVEARYQTYAVNTFEKLGRVCTQLAGHNSEVEKFKRGRVCKENVTECVRQITELAAGLQTLYDNLSAQHRGLGQVREPASQYTALQI